jgi:hypothetical protein
MGIVISIKRVERKGDRTDEGITKRKIRKEWEEGEEEEEEGNESF